jgi:heptaprenyl diphosphate synthase
VMFARRSTDPADSRLLELLRGPFDDDARLTEALELLRAHPAMGQARAYVRDLASQATAALEPIDDGPVKDALVAFADHIATRTA